MSDLVQRLRTDADLMMEWNSWEMHTNVPDPLDYEKTACLEVEAADRIEALEAALREIAAHSSLHDAIAERIARRALEGKSRE